MEDKAKEFRKFVRLLRIIHDEETSSQMAKKLNVSAAYLSQVENNKRELTKQLIDKLIDVYQLSQADQIKIRRIFGVYKNRVHIEFDGMSEKKREIALKFAEEVNSFSDEKVLKMQELLQLKNQ